MPASRSQQAVVGAAHSSEDGEGSIAARPPASAFRQQAVPRPARTWWSSSAGSSWWSCFSATTPSPPRSAKIRSVLKDRLSTRELLRRRNMELESYTCVLCNDSEEESIVHLFSTCTFAYHCWHSLGVQTSANLSPQQNLEMMRTQINKPFFMEVIILTSWAIWMSRNNKIFKNVPPSVQSCRAIFKMELSSLLWRAKKKILPSLQEWLQRLN